MVQEINVDEWIDCFSRASSGEDTNDGIKIAETTIIGNDDTIKNLTNNDDIKKENFDLYKHKTAASPKLIDVERYYDQYNINAVRADIYFLAPVYTTNGEVAKKRTNNSDPLVAAGSQDEIETQWISLKDIAANMAGSAGVSNNNNNFFVSMSIEDSGSFKRLTLTLIDRTFTTLAGYIHDAIETGNGNVSVFEKSEISASERRRKALEGSKEVTLASGTNLTFLAPESKKVKNNLMISYGYHIENNTPSPFFNKEGSSTSSNSTTERQKDYWGAASHRWTSANTWSKDSQNEKEESVNPGNVLQYLKHQTTEKIPPQEYFMTELETTLTNTGMIYTIKATNTEAFELNNLKFMQQYTNLRGTPKRLLASLMNVFNSSEDAPAKLVWYDDPSNAKNYLNGSAVLKNYKDGTYVLANEDEIVKVLDNERSVMEDIRKQIEVLKDLQAIINYNPNNNLRINGSPVFYNETAVKEASEFIKTGEYPENEVTKSVDKGQRYSTYLYAFRKEVSGGKKDNNEGKISFDPKKCIAWAHDFSVNNGYYSLNQKFAADEKVKITKQNLAAAWLSLVGLKVYNLSSFDYRINPQEPYEEFERVKIANSSKEKLAQAGNNLKKKFDDSVKWIETAVFPGGAAQYSSTYTEKRADGNTYKATLGLCGCFGLNTAFKLPDEDTSFKFDTSIPLLSYVTPNQGSLGTGDVREHGNCGFINTVSLKQFSLGLDEENLELLENKSKAKDYINSQWTTIKEGLSNCVFSSDCLNSWNYTYQFCKSLSNNPDKWGHFKTSAQEAASKLLDVYKNYNISNYDISGKDAITNYHKYGNFMVSTKDVIVGAQVFTSAAVSKNFSVRFLKEPKEIVNDFKDLQKKFDEAYKILQNGGDYVIKSNNNTESLPKWSEYGIKANGEIIQFIKDDGTLPDKFIQVYDIDDIDGKDNEGYRETLKAVFDFLNKSCNPSQNIINCTLKEIVEQLRCFFISLNKLLTVYDKDLATYESEGLNYMSEIAGNNMQNFKEYVIDSLEETLKEYAICLIDCYVKSKAVFLENKNKTDEKEEYWINLEKKVVAKINGDEKIYFNDEQRKAKIKKNGSKFEDAYLGTSYDGLEDYYQELMGQAFGGQKQNLEKLEQKISSDLVKYTEDLDEISKEYESNSNKGIGQPISISLGGEDSQDLSNVYSKSLSSLFNDFCSQCMPLAKATDIVSTASKDEEGNQNTTVLTEDGANYHLAWSVVGKYKTKNGSYQPIVGFYYKKPSRPGYIRNYHWGTGNAKQHIVKDLSIKTSSEFAMYSSIKAINIKNGVVTDATDKDNNNSLKLTVSRIQETASDTMFPNFINRNRKQTNIMNNLMKAINKGTITLLGDPSLVFVDEIQPYRYPIHLDIKLQQEGAASWSNGSSVYENSYLSGYYLVTKITHSISSAGYTTTLEVIKYPGLEQEYSAYK